LKERFEKHKKHLKETGFLAERTFYGVEDINQFFYIRDEVKKRVPAKRLRFVDLRGAFNSVTITTASEDMPICEKIVAEGLRSSQ
jgi:hypothetical protein